MNVVEALKRLLGAPRRGPKRGARPSAGVGRERDLVEDLRKSRVTALCMGPILVFAGLILGAVILGVRPLREWTSTGSILTLVVCTCWIGGGIAMIVWACRWTPEAWAQRIIKRMDRTGRSADRRPESRRHEPNDPAGA